MSEDAGSEDVTINVLIKCNNSDKADICISAAALVGDLKVAVEAKLSIASAQQRLIYKGKILKDEIALQVYNIEEGSIIHLVKGLARSSADGPGAAPASAPVQQQQSSSSAVPTPNGFPAFPASASNNPFMGMGGLGGTGMDSMMNNPEMMAQMMNNPMVQNMLNDPETLRNMMMSNPQIQGMMEANPQLRHVLSDPSVLRQTMEMMRNPNAMREAMRSQDLAISHLENVPGGFNALRRMYEEIQEPMMEATQSGSLFGSPSPSPNPYPAPSSASPLLTAPNTSALPNPWAGASASSAPNSFGGMGGLPGMGGMGGFPGMGGMGGLPGMGGMGGLPGRQNPQELAALMSNPQYQQMLTQMLNNPGAISQLSAMNPQLGAMLQDPQARAMLTSPETLRIMSDPQALQAMMSMEQSMRTLQSRGFNMPGMPALGPPPAGGIGSLDFSSILGAGAGTGAATPGIFGGMSPQPPADPATTFTSQLRQLQDMGFTNQPANIAALVRSNGNVNSAVEFLLSQI